MLQTAIVKDAYPDEQGPLPLPPDGHGPRRHGRRLLLNRREHVQALYGRLPVKSSKTTKDGRTRRKGLPGRPFCLKQKKIKRKRERFMEIRLLEDPAEKRAVTRLVLEDLPEWFGIPESAGRHILRRGAAQPFFLRVSGTGTPGRLLLSPRDREGHRRGGRDGRAPGIPPAGHRPGAFTAGEGGRAREGVFVFAGQDGADGALCGV